MNQTINTARQADKYTKIGNRFHHTFDFIAFFMVRFEFLPWVSLTLFHTQRDATTIFINFQNHHFYFITHLNYFTWVNILVSPVHFRNMYQTFNALLDFHKCTIVSQIGDFTKQTGTLRITTSQTIPRIFTQLFQAQRNTAAFLIKFQYFSFNFLTNFQHFAWMFNTTPCQISNMQQAINATQINKSTVIGNVFHNTFYY